MQKPLKNGGFPVVLPAVCVLAVKGAEIALLTPEGEVRKLSPNEAQTLLHRQPVMLCHAPFVRAHLNLEHASQIFDVLELFAFVHPAKFCVPTPSGLAKNLGLDSPQSLDDYPSALLESAQALLADLQREVANTSSRPALTLDPDSESPPASTNHPAPDSDSSAHLSPLAVAAVMGMHGKGWAWTPFIHASLGHVYDPAQEIGARQSLHVWRHLPAWAEEAPPPPPGHKPVTGDETRERLKLLLSRESAQSGRLGEARPQQLAYATQMTAAFAPAGPAQDNPEDGHTEKEPHNEPHVILAEAGTGTGKTLGYLAPASVWAEKNEGTVWVSTYTRNLQRQLDRELDRVYPDPVLKDHKVAVRKGRENYLCLLNLEDLVAGAALAKSPGQAIAAGLMARWAETTRDGDLSGADFPGWLPGLLGIANSLGLADRRGECLYAACEHYHKCFVERSVRKSRHARIVVANHALVMGAAANGGFAEGALPRRIVFDEGHHLFDAADSAFSAHLTARETADLRRWLLGPENNAKSRSRARGLRRRIEDLVEGDDAATLALDAILQGAHTLPDHGWSRRLKDKNPQGTAENFLMLVYQQVFARSEARNTPYSLETATLPMIDGLPQAADLLHEKLKALQKPMLILARHFRARLEAQSDTLDTDTRRRLDSVATSLTRRGDHMLGGWIAMLETLTGQRMAEDDSFIDWMEIERVESHAVDVGLYRHWIDPMRAFAAVIKPEAHGIAITSATLRDRGGDEEESWRAAMERTGARYLSASPQRLSLPSPFNYGERTCIFVITDVRKDDLTQIAAAYRALFEASGGGALGLFTAIQRLRGVYDKIQKPLDEAGLALYAQHIDGIDTGTLVDIFRDEKNACLLGTDAVRDGIDVPGDALRLLVYDRVPWPRPTILHKARRNEFGLRRYDEMTARLRLQQAFGRLIRRADDKGVFVMLDSGLPTRLHSAFPEGVTIERIGLADAVQRIKDFL